MSDIIDEYKKLVNFLGLVVGYNCEIALQDVRKGRKGIVAIVNGHISGRKIGSPLTDLANKIIAEGIWKDKDFYSNYTGVTTNKKRLRSSTYFIKENGRLLGMLCINIDESKYIDLCKTLLSLSGTHLDLGEITQTDSAKPVDSESFYGDINDVTDSVIKDFFKERPAVPIDRLTQEEKMDIVRQLEEKSVFMVKGAVSKVANKLDISAPTLYRYLKDITKNDK